MSSGNTPQFSLAGKRVWVAGHRGMVGSALVRRLSSEDCEVLTVGREKVDLRRQAEVETWMDETRPEVVIVAAATVGGIAANNQYPADFLYDNLAIEANVIHSAYKTQVSKLLFIASSCIYPRLAPQPIQEQSLLTGPLEPTNQWYAVAKIAAIKLCQAYRRQYRCDFISAMPPNLYGPGDTFDLEASHVIAALMLKAHSAKISGAADMEIWGTGKPLREFLYVDDAADGFIYLMKHYSGEEHVNVGSDYEVSISELARLVSEVVEFSGGHRYLTDRPDGTPRKLLDSAHMTSLGWTPKTPLRKGLQQTYQWFSGNVVAQPVL